MEFEDNEACLPVELEKEDKFHSADYNCSECDQTDCIYWYIYHPDINLV